MSRKSIKTFPLLTFICLMGCGDSKELSPAESAGIIKEVTSTLQNYYRDIKSSGLMAELNYLDSSEDFFWVPPGYTSALSYDSVVTILKRNGPGLASVENSFDTLSVTALSDKLAVYTGRLRSVVIDTAGMKNEYVMMETGVMIKRESGWKLLSGQTGMVEMGAPPR